MADRYFINGGVDNNWGSTSNWSATDGGGGGESVPSNVDDVYLTSLSPNCIVNASARSCRGIDFTGYTNTIDMQQTLSTAAGGVVLSPSMSITSSGALTVTATSSITSNGKVWPNELVISISSTGTCTLMDDWEVLGNVTLGPTPAITNNINGFSIKAHSDVQIRPTNVLTGTTEIILVGTGDLYGNTSTGFFTTTLPITFNTTGTVTIPSGTTWGQRGNVKYLSGNIVATGANLTVSIATVATDMGNAVFSNVTISGNAVVQLDRKLSCSGLLTLGGGLLPKRLQLMALILKLLGDCDTGAQQDE